MRYSEASKKIKELSTETLLQYYANARETSSAGGHYKSQMNERAAKEYSEELKRREILVPEDVFSEVVANVEIPKGIFNGDGSF